MVNAFTNTAPPSIQFQSSAWAWSSDGRYVAPNVDVVAFMDAPNATRNEGPSMQGEYTPPYVAAPDAAADAVVREVASRKVVAYVALDPRGGRLASLLCEADGDTGKLTIRAAAIGRTLASEQYQFPASGLSFGCLGDAEAINWSPDGSRVAMTDNQDGQIVVWRISASR